MLFPDNDYTFYITLIDKEFEGLIEGLSSLDEMEVFGSRIEIKATKADMFEFDRVILEDSPYYKIRFLTPAILTLPASTEKYGHERHVLFPHTFLIFHSLIRHWNLYAPRDLVFFDPYRLARYAYYNLMEVDYSIKPKTVIYDERRRFKDSDGSSSPYRFLPLPDPVLLFRSLARLWRRFSNLDIGIKGFMNWVEMGGVAIYGYPSGIRTYKAYDHQTDKWSIGFLGSVYYNMPDDIFEPKMAKVAEALLKFGEYSNVGGGRTAGLGMVRYRATKSD